MNAPSPPPQAAIFDLVLGFWSAGAVAAAARLGVPDALSKGPRTAEEIAPQLGVDASALYRLMRAVATAGMFVKDERGRFGLTPTGEFLRSDVPGSARAFLVSELDGAHWAPWGRLAESVRTGEPMFDKIFSMPAWQYYRDVNPEEGRMFAASMTALSDMETHAILGAYAFSGVKRIVDVGGGHGGFLGAILQTLPEAQGVLFDQAQVVAGAHSTLEAFGVAERVELVGGDFLASVPRGGDMYLLKHILHDWDDASCVTILTHIRESMAPGGRVAIAEMPVVEGSPGRMTALLDLNMLLMLPGKERTAEEYGALLDRAGLRMDSVTSTQSGIALIEGRAR